MRTCDITVLHPFAGAGFRLADSGRHSALPVADVSSVKLHIRGKPRGENSDVPDRTRSLCVSAIMLRSLIGFQYVSAAQVQRFASCSEFRLRYP